jgi:hypothetical protein
VLTCALAILASGTLHAGRDGIRAEDLRRHVIYLASDSLAGRETGEPGIRKAEKYIAREFRKAGLEPLPGRDDYWIDFTLYRSGYASAGTFVALELDGRSTKARAGVDFRPFPFSDDGEVEAPVVFVGYGITAPELAYDDYAGVDVKGKIVLMLRHEPAERDPNSSFDGASSTQHAVFTTKAENAQEHDAAGMLLVTDPVNHGPDDDLRLDGTLRLKKPEPPDDTADVDYDPPFLALHISQRTASTIVASAGLSLEEMQRAVDTGSPAAEFSLKGVTAHIGVERSETIEEVTARNVAGFLEGRDPELKDEWVVIGGHHDHIGGYAGEGDTVYNGADDNASGTSGVIALARAFSRRSEKPRRSIAFVTFSGEEKGLLGSRALVGQKLVPMDKVVFMLNLDMIGRNSGDEIQLVGDGYSNGAREIAEAANREIGLPLDFGGASYAGDSDHDAFYEEDVPFLFFFTGVHDDYHQLGDQADKLDYERMESILRLAYGIADRVAEADEAPRFIHHIRWLGLRLELLDDGGASQAVVTAVHEASRAAAAGMRTGDVVTEFDHESVDPARVGRRFREVQPGSWVALGVRRGDEDVVLSVERAKTGYLGVDPGALDEDRRRALGLRGEEGIVLRRVMADGPADRAGLKEGDILVGLSGRSVGRRNLRERLMQIGAGETVEVMVIREGERLTLPVKLGERPNRR